MTDKKIVFFDVGGVLIRFLFDFFIERLARMFGVRPIEMSEFLESIWVDIEIGLNEKGIYDLFSNRFGVSVEMREFIEVFGLSIEAQDEYRRRPLFERLRGARVELGIISNANVIHVGQANKRFPGLFAEISREKCFYSFEMGLRKDASGEMFLKACELCGADPKKSILVDDLVENVAGVKNAGGRGILFRGFHRLEYDLIQLGVLAQ